MIKKSDKKTAAPSPSALTVASPAKSTSPSREVTFGVYEPRAEQVFLCGAFNNWSPDTTPLARKQNRDWKTTLSLAPGRYEYKFVIDGQWRLDPRASETVSNAFGTLNSIVEVKA
jgi:1,4-alpha-glucan branching enzyme